MSKEGSERLLVLAPTGRDAELAVAVLVSAGIDAQACRDVVALCAELALGAGAVLITEEALSPNALTALARVVATQEPWSDLPFVVFASRPGAIDSGGVYAEPLAALGNATVVDRPLRRRTLVSVARAALRARERQYAARELLARLRKNVRDRDQFLALLGHELRNPLAAIDTASELLARGVAPARPLAVVRRQTQQLSRLVDDLLDVSRVSSGKVSLRRCEFDLREAVLRCVEAQTSAAAEAGVELRADLSGPVLVDGDEARIDQVLWNLVGNAVKYTPYGGHVRVTLVQEGTSAVVRVRDDGIGMAAEDLDRVFEPFVQLSAAIDRARGGMGLGLTLVHSLVQLHGGTVNARSEGRGRGSEFSVRLPALIGDAAASAVTERRPACPARDVLVVEDNDDARETLAMMLELGGHAVRQAVDGTEALALARERRPDLALVDIGLPLLDGYEVARRLRAEHGRGLFLVALTGYGQPEDRDRTADAGFDVHLTKPAEFARVEALLRTLRADAA
jgi:signal transduction histidine kinase/CheY-like chemotaxis protein